MLPNYYKFHIYNDTGVTLDFSVDDELIIIALPYKYDTSGAISYGSEITVYDDGAADLADGAEDEYSEIDNTTNLYEGLFCTARLTSDDSPDGNILIYLEWNSEDTSGQNTYPSDATDFDAARADTDMVLVGIITPEGAADDNISKNFQVHF
jgi:hypothetical protein